MFSQSVFLLFLFCSLEFTVVSVDSTADCDNSEDGMSCENISSKLWRLNPSKVGDHEDIYIAEQKYSLKTISLKPLLFEVEDFITSEECDHLIDLAEMEGLQESETRQHEIKRRMIIRDVNNDRKLSVNEMMLTIEDNFDLYPNEEDILKLYSDLALDKNNDKFITPDELETIEHKILENYLKQFSESQPVKRSRHSKQTWIYPDKSTDPVFKNIQQRVQELTNLHPVLIEKSDFQVVNYGVEGHYNAHHDSSKMNTDRPCCTRRKTTACRICRFATILMYLNDVEEGGETAFPVADNITLDSNQFITHHQTNLVRYCSDANAKVTPTKGKVVLWYNHLIDPTTGWVGEMDEYSWHGGCPVTKGHKWIANFWIKFTDDKQASLSRYQ